MLNNIKQYIIFEIFDCQRLYLLRYGEQNNIPADVVGGGFRNSKGPTVGGALQE
jgi:hypothetical protein